MQINSFQYYLPVNLIFGPGKTEVLGEEAARYGKKAMIVTGRHSTKRSGLLGRAKSLLEKAGADSMITPREIIRSYIGLLHIMRQNPGVGFSEVMGKASGELKPASASSEDDSLEDFEL